MKRWQPKCLLVGMAIVLVFCIYYMRVLEKHYRRKMQKLEQTTIEQKHKLQDQEKFYKRRIDSLYQKIKSLQKEVDFYESRRKAVEKILAKTPLQNYAKWFVRAERKEGVNACLVAAISLQESGGGRYCYGYNAFGILVAGEGTGLRRYKSWEEGIMQAFRFVRKHWGRAQTPYQLKGYCASNRFWAEEVSRGMRRQSK